MRPKGRPTVPRYHCANGTHHKAHNAPRQSVSHRTVMREPRRVVASMHRKQRDRRLQAATMALTIGWGDGGYTPVAGSMTSVMMVNNTPTMMPVSTAQPLVSGEAI